MTLPRITCPACSRDVPQRKDGTPRSHYPPPDRLDLACGPSHPSHCRGSHPQETTRPSVRGGARLHPSDEDGYREEQGT